MISPERLAELEKLANEANKPITDDHWFGDDQIEAFFDEFKIAIPELIMAIKLAVELLKNRDRTIDELRTALKKFKYLDDVVVASENIGIKDAE